MGQPRLGPQQSRLTGTALLVDEVGPVACSSQFGVTKLTACRGASLKQEAIVGCCCQDKNNNQGMKASVRPLWELE